MKQHRFSRPLRRSVVFLLLLAMLFSTILSPVAFASDPELFENSETYLRSSYHDQNYLEFAISGSILTVRGVLLLDGLTGVMVRCGEEKIWLQDASCGSSFSASFPLSRIIGSSSEPVAVSVYTQQGTGNSYWSMTLRKVYVQKENGGYRILESEVLDHNLAFADTWLYPADFLTRDIPDSVREMSNTIVGSETDNYEKIWLLHKWTAENIYYDHDCLTNTPNSEWVCDSAGVLELRRSVCEGYASLLRDFILAQGIPCFKANTLSIQSSFAVSKESANAVTPNHTHVEAYVDGRWITMDPTWDSNNDYENGTYITGASSGFAHFDITPEMLALDHKLITRGNNVLRLDDDGSFENTSPWKYGSVPSSWAIEEVRAAYEFGIIPEELTQKYTGNITRSEFCRLIMQMMMVRYRADSLDELLDRYDLTMQEGLFLDTEDPYIYAASLLGIVNGTGNGLFTPDREITREEAATMLGRLANKIRIGTGEVGIAFSDLDQVSAWARDSVLFVSSLTSRNGMRVMSGTGSNKFSPKGDYTVEQAILTVYRLYFS